MEQQGMKWGKIERPSASTVIALLALVLSLGSGAYAAFNLPRESVGTRELKDNAVNSSKVLNRSLRVREFRAGELAFLESEQIALPPRDLVLTQNLTEVISLGDHNSELITMAQPTRLVATGTVTIRNTGIGTPIAECALASRPDFSPSFNEFSFESWQTAQPGPLAHMTVPVTGSVSEERGVWDVAIRCRNATPDNSDLDVHAAHLNVIALPRSWDNSPP
jgi:hypothetical protein